MPLEAEPYLLAAIIQEEEARRIAFVPGRPSNRDFRPSIVDQPNGYENLDILKARAVLLTLRKNGLDICWESHLTHNDDSDLTLYGVLSIDTLRMQYQRFQREIWHNDSGTFKTTFRVERIVYLCQQHFPEDPTKVNENLYIPEYAIFSEVVERDGKLIKLDGGDVSTTFITRRIYTPVFRAIGVHTPIRDLYATTYKDPETVIYLNNDQF